MKNHKNGTKTEDKVEIKSQKPEILFSSRHMRQSLVYKLNKPPSKFRSYFLVGPFQLFLSYFRTKKLQWNFELVLKGKR